MSNQKNRYVVWVRVAPYVCRYLVDNFGVKDENINGDWNSFFEIKAKINGLVVKRRVKMRLDDAMKFTAFTQKLIADGAETSYLLSAENLEELRKFEK